MDDPRTHAVLDNAAWCDAVCRALGHATEWSDGLWMDLDPAPPYYSNAVTTSPHDREAQLDAIRRMLAGPLPRPWTIKDGFHVLDLAPLGFDVLFEATWLGLPADASLRSPVVEDEVTWSVVQAPEGLVAWERAWAGENPDVSAASMRHLFGPALLEHPGVRFVQGHLEGRIVAVAVASRSAAGTGPVVGISNIVLGGADGERYRGALVQAVRDTFPGLPLVGYEWGDDLERMLGVGLEAIGPLRVWITR